MMHPQLRGRGGRALLVRASVGLAALVAASPVLAQQAPVSPVTITPGVLAPEPDNRGFRVDIPDSGALRPPPGAQGMAVTLGSVVVEGAFPEVADEVRALTAPLEGRRASLAEIYAVASEIEAAHAQAGYVLARVSVPPQDLNDGGVLRIVVIDGFIEAVDASALPARIRGAIEARAGGLVGKRRLTMNEIETALMLTSDLPGLDLRSTLMRGEKPGGARLVLEGQHKLVTGSLGVDNSFDPSLGRWNVMLGVSINSLLGLGEQIYGFGSSEYRLDNLFSDRSRARVGGGGVIVPFGDGRFSINPEVTFARTAPDPADGAPYTVGTLRRITLRGNVALVRLRREQAGLTATIEQIEVSNKAPDFAATISRDRYLAARLGANWSRQTRSGARYSARVQLSQGLGNLGAISRAEADAAGIPFSRDGAATDFTRFNAALGASWKPSAMTTVAFTLRGQTSFGAALFRAEQMSLEGADGLSAYVGGLTAVDSGLVARQEVSAAIRTGGEGSVLPYVAPYVFAAYGAGVIERPTAIEQRHIGGFNLGGGLRTTLARRIELGVEYARGISDDAALDRVDRVSASATLRF